MENSTQLANRFREVLLNGKWIANTNYRDQLSNVSWQEATHKIGSLNTIAALTYHINYYIEGILKFFEEGTLDMRDKYSFDAPPIRSQEDWNDRLNNLWANAEKFANRIEQMPDEQLEEVFIKKEYGSYRRNIEGVIEHSYYHLGQISLIGKMIRETTFLDIHPKLPMRDKSATRDFYVQKLGFREFGNADYDDYLMLEKDRIQIHFFRFRELDPHENYGQVYIRTSNIDQLYQSFLDNNAVIHPNGTLQIKPWGQKEFSLLDPDHNLLTFGQTL